jgi:hypothetical protein
VTFKTLYYINGVGFCFISLLICDTLNILQVLTKVFIVMNVGKFLAKFPKEIMQEKKFHF